MRNWERGIGYPPDHCHKRLAKALGFGPRMRADFYKDSMRSRLWEAITEDYNRMIDEKFKELI